MTTFDFDARTRLSPLNSWEGLIGGDVEAVVIDSKEKSVSLIPIEEYQTTATAGLPPGRLSHYHW